MVNWEDLSNIEIREKYLKAPSFDEIFSFIDELGVNYSQFERFYSIPHSVIRSIKCGTRQLPVKFWPVIYERIVPQYGIKFQAATKLATKHKRVASKKAFVAQQPDTGNHDRLVTVK